MTELTNIAAVAAGGAVGAAGRYALTRLVAVASPWPAYVGTFAVNITGCLAIGIVFALIDGDERPDWHRALLVSGILGAFTTFSTFSLEAMELIHSRRLTELGAYVLGSVVVGLVAVKVGMWLGS